MTHDERAQAVLARWGDVVGFDAERDLAIEFQNVEAAERKRILGIINDPENRFGWLADVGILVRKIQEGK